MEHGEQLLEDMLQCGEDRGELAEVPLALTQD